MPELRTTVSQVNPLQENIARLRRYAETVGSSLPEPGSPLTASIERSLDEVRRLVQETIVATGSPVRIGVVGEFDAGKSLLLGALIGDATALPVSHLPTTGNITALSLRSQPGLTATQVSGHTIEWLDRASAIECLKELLRAAEERARGLGDIDRTALEKLRAAADQGPWRDVEACCRHSWDRCGSPPSPRLRQVLREMAWFARCCSSPAGQALLEKGPRSTPLPQAEVACHALQLPHATNLTQMTYDELPGGPGAAVPNPMTADFLQSALPLVRRLTADVRLPPELWDVSGDQDGTPFLLLDFPGLGADESGVRDSFLCDRELREVQTILVVLKGDRIGSDVGAALFARLQAGRPEGHDLRDNILVGINRFDQLPGGPPERPEAVREADLQATAPVLHAALVSASNLTPYPERVVLLSALAALDRMTSAGRSVGADRFLSLAAAALEDWNARVGPAWEKVAGQLAADNPRSLLGHQLSELVADGGLARLKALLVDHVGRYGLRQLLDRVKDLAAQLRKAYEGLPRVSPAQAAGARLSVAGIQDQVRRLRQAYAQVQQRLRAEPVLTVRREGREQPLREVVARQVRDRVWNWPVWNSLLNQIEGGRFRPARVIRRSRRTEVPKDSKAFLDDPERASFAETLRECWDAVQEGVQEAVPHLLAGLAAQVGEQAAPLVRLLADRQIDERVARLPGRAGPVAPKELLQSLRSAANPAGEEVRDEILEEVFSEEKTWDAERYYPLAGTKGDEYPQALPWSSSAEDPELFNDQFLLMRLRNQLVKGARHPVLQRVQELSERVFNLLDEFFGEWIDDLAQVNKNRALLQALAGDEIPEGGWRAAEVKWPLPG
jgi:hypothetical protein